MLVATLGVVAFVPGASGQTIVRLPEFKVPLPRPGQIELIRLDAFPAPGSPRPNRIELCLENRHVPGSLVVVGNTSPLTVGGEHGFTGLLLVANPVKAPASPPPDKCELTWFGPGGQSGGPTGTVYTHLGQLAAPGFKGYMQALCNFHSGHGLALVGELPATSPGGRLTTKERGLLSALVHGRPTKVCAGKPPVDPGPEALLLLDAPPVHPVQLYPGPKATTGTPKKLLAEGIRLFTAELDNDPVATTGRIIAEIERSLQGDLNGDGKVGTLAPTLYRYSIPAFTVSYTGPAATHAPVITEAFAGGSGCGDPAKDVWLVPFTVTGIGNPTKSTARVVFAQHNPYLVVTNRFDSPSGAAQAQTSLRYIPGASPKVNVEFTKQGGITGVTGAPKTLPVKLEAVKSCG